MRISSYILSLGLFLTLIQCGGDGGPSSQVSLSVTPSSPVVITSDLIIPVGASRVTVTAPYMAVNITISNASSETLNVSGIRFESTYDSTDKSGKVTTVESGPIDIGPSAFTAFQYSYIKTTPACSSIDTAAQGTVAYCDQTLFAQLTQGQTHTLSFEASGMTQYLMFYFSNLPKSDGKNFVYRGKLTLLGYFGSPTNITNRLTKSIYFNSL